MTTNSPSILIVDDERNMRSTMADILRDEGYDVSTAETGERAVKMCDKRVFDVVLMDVRMPGIDGVEAFRLIRRRHAGIRVIMMSAYSVDEMQKAALAEGAVAFLRKPLELDRVLALINEARETSILLVEEDEETANGLVTTMRRSGFRVTRVDGPSRALELVDQIRFDVIIIDVELSSLNGLDLYRAIRGRTSRSHVVMVAGPSEASRHTAEAALAEGAEACLSRAQAADQVVEMLQRFE